ncbi:hypothetical protein K6U70_12175, partial [Vibrio vulnificus]
SSPPDHPTVCFKLPGLSSHLATETLTNPQPPQPLLICARTTSSADIVNKANRTMTVSKTNVSTEYDEITRL